MLKKLLLFVLCICTWWIISNRIGTRLDVRGGDVQCSSGNDTPPYYFRVLVVSNADQPSLCEARIVAYSQLREVTAQEPRWSYQVPNGSENRLNKQVAADAPAADADYESARIVQFKVKRLSNGKQRIALQSCDGVDRSCYIAQPKSIAPISFSTGMRGRDTLYAFGTIVGIFVNGALWLALFGIAGVVRHFRRKCAQSKI